MTTQGVTSDGVPISDGFDFPVGPRGADVFKTHYVATVLADAGYYEDTTPACRQVGKGAWHPGEDWNGNGGRNTDLGHPVYAISNGKVVDFGNYESYWGQIILLEHALPDGSRVWSQYAHLGQMLVRQKGQQVKRGQQIGTIGKGGSRATWYAHLHFEIRKKSLRIDNWCPMVLDRSQVLANYHHPQAFINARRPGQGIFAASQGQTTTPPPTKREPIHIIVDSEHVDRTMGVFARKDTPHFYTAPNGYFGTMLWTVSTEANESIWGEWRPALPEEGQWQVWAFIPAENGTTTSARYLITHLDGKILIGLDQSKYANKWAYLGTYRFAPGRGYVRLTNLTGERGQPRTKIAFDAMAWTLPGS